MEEAFVIMQIGNPRLDLLWKEIYQPAIKECGLDSKRVDKHGEGRLLQSEIADFIKRATIVIADLTNERPNCYLEVGYTMGINKFRNLILCAREDHNQDSPNHVKDGPKIHFDLSGYSFLWWNEKELEKFKEELASTIKYRLDILKKNGKTSAEKAIQDNIIKKLEVLPKESLILLKEFVAEGGKGFYVNEFLEWEEEKIRKFGWNNKQAKGCASKLIKVFIIEHKVGVRTRLSLEEGYRSFLEQYLWSDDFEELLKKK